MRTCTLAALMSMVLACGELSNTPKDGPDAGNEAGEGTPGASSSSSSGGGRSTCNGDLAGPCVACSAGILSGVEPLCQPGDWMKCPANSTEVICEFGYQGVGIICDPATGKPVCGHDEFLCGGSMSCRVDELCVVLGGDDAGPDAGSHSACVSFPTACALGTVTAAEQCACLTSHVSADAGADACGSFSCAAVEGRPVLTCTK